MKKILYLPIMLVILLGIFGFGSTNYANSFDGELNGFDEELNGFDEELNGFDEELNGFDEELNGFDRELNGFDEGLNGFDEGLNGFDVELNSDGGGAGRCFGSTTATSSLGSKIILDCGTDGWGYQHIRKKHMTGEITGGTKFSEVYSMGDIMIILMDVIDNDPTLEYQNDAKTRAYKEIYSEYENKKVRVVLHKGNNWYKNDGTTYSNYDWVIVSAYPRN